MAARTKIFPWLLASLLSLPAAAMADPPPASDDVVAGKLDALANDPTSPVLGNPHGDVTVVEFFDYACSYCKAVEPRLEALLQSDKRVKLVVKEFPILTPASLLATRVALASVKQGKYARFHQALMNYRGALTEEAILGTAKDSGLNIARLKADMAAPQIADIIIADFNLARALRLFQTPAFIVGTHILTGPSAEINFPKMVAVARAAARH